MDRRTFLAAASAGIAGCAGIGGSTTPTPDYDVGMRASAFVPEEIEVAAGETVVWRNTSSRPHSVTAYGNLLPEGAAFFASGGYESEEAAREAWVGDLGGAIYTGGTYEHTFEQPGTYEYFCIPHERQGMTGRVVVG